MEIGAGTFFWANAGAFAVHIVDELSCRGRFVERVREKFMPGMNWTKFWLGNLAFLALLVGSAWVYGARGGRWIVLPLVWLIERPGNTVWHVWWSLKFREYSPGLATSFLFPLNLSAFLYCVALPGHVAREDLGLALALGAAGWLFFSTAPPLVFRFRAGAQRPAD